MQGKERIFAKILAHGVVKLYQTNHQQPAMFEYFHLPFGGKLNPNNRWVQLAELIPWDFVEERYTDTFASPYEGQKAYPVRTALGSLIIKERLGLSDRETVEQIRENAYLQYFIGFTSFQDEAPFHHSLMTHFRYRLDAKLLAEVNERIAVEAARRQMESEPSSKEDDHDDEPPFTMSSLFDLPEEQPATPKKKKEPNKPRHKKRGKRMASKPAGPNENKGTLMLDATCAPSDIKYPTDMSLLNEAREKLEDIIDTLHQPLVGRVKKPRTYRQKGRKSWLSFSKTRRPSVQKIRRFLREQLSFVGRNLRTIEQLSHGTPLTELSRRQYRDLLVISELYRQQRLMYAQQTHKMDDRIVSIEQPYIRPIVRGKAVSQVEFGAKTAVSLVNGYTFIEHMQFDNFNESQTLQTSIETYKTRFGYYPEVVLADKIYRNRTNVEYCKSLGIRLSGPRLGRPPANKKLQADDRRQEREDSARRNEIEGKFGEGKRKYGLGLIRARRAVTSMTVIALQFLVMNLERRLRVLFVFIFKWLGFRNIQWA